MYVLYVLGPIGTGKSTYITKILLPIMKNLKYLSADTLKEMEHLTYLEARTKMGTIIQAYVETEIDFVTEGTGQHDDMYDLFLSYKKNPKINLQIIYIDIDLDVALKRNKMRKRVLSDKTVIEVYKRSQERKELWKKFNCTYIDYKDIIIEDIDGEYGDHKEQ